MTENVKYTRNVNASAMSKRVNQAGMNIEDASWYSESGKNVVLHSINAKDGKITSHLHLQIPKESLQEVIDALKRFL